MEQKRKENNYSIRKIYVIIGILLMLIGAGIILFDILSNKNMDNIESKAMDKYYEEKEIVDNNNLTMPNLKNNKDVPKIEYIGVLSIPKINLKRGLVDPNSSLNNIEYNVTFLSGSSMPDEMCGNVILAAHSGTARISYFKNLDKLDLNDEVIIDYMNNTYKYYVFNKYEIEKTGGANIIRDTNKTTLTLITCKHNTNKQIVVVCELKDLN